MLEALSEAQKAYDGNEVPIGCVVVCGGRIIAREHNTKIADNDSLRHAELKALTAAQKILKTKYLYDCELYVTVEPCAMCAGAMINARLGKLFYALKEPKTGCCGSVYNLLEDGKFNHTVKVSGGMMEDKALILMQKFFREKRGQDE
jgi:tRNA(adenine34) deaminase